MNRRRFIALCSAVVGAVGSGLWYLVDFRWRSRLVNGPMVQAVTPDRFSLVWEMHQGEPARLILSAAGEPDREWTIAPASTSLVDPRVARYEHVLTGLRPDHLYTYDIGPGLIRETVRTAPARPQPFRFLALGDTGDGEMPQWQTARILPDHLPDLVIHTGDLVYPDGDIIHYPANFYRPYARLISHVPIYPCLGNHDVKRLNGKAFVDTFLLPRNGPPGSDLKREYWFDHSGARFIALDSNREFEHLRDVVAPWLDGVLVEAKSMWKIVFFHEPIYTHGKYEMAVKLLDSVGPMFDKHRVHLVLCGHNHMYERTHPLRNGQIVGSGDGTVYITTAAGGAGLYHLRLPAPEYLAFWESKHHGFTVVDVSADVMHLRQIGGDGTLIDNFTIPRDSSKHSLATLTDLRNDSVAVACVPKQFARAPSNPLEA